MNSGTITNQLLDAVQVLVDDAVKRAEFDRTVQAVVAKCVSSTKGKYSVKYQGGYFYAYAQDPNVTYSPDTQVYVLIPGNDMSKIKTIIGTVDKLGQDFITAEENSFYEYIGNNVCSTTVEDYLYKLDSYLVTDGKVLYDSENNILDEHFNIDLEAANLYLKNSDYLVMAANFRTNLPLEHRSKGNYGLKYTLTFEDSLTGEEVDREYILDINSMSGTPYNQPVAIRQHIEFEIDGESFKKIKKIEIFSKDFVSTNGVNPAQYDIFISNIELLGAILLSPDENDGYVLSLATKQGTIFYENDLDTATRRIEAEIYKNKELQKVTSEDVAYYWFKENGSIYIGNPKYVKYGKVGWECLNEYSLDSNGNRVYKTNKSFLDISKQTVPAKTTKIKCVVIYRDTALQLSKEIILYNKSSNYSVELSSSEGTFTDAATTVLTCTVTGVEPLHLLKYSWSRLLDDATYYTEIITSGNSTLTANLNQAIKRVSYKCSVEDTTLGKNIGTATILITRGQEDQEPGYYYVVINDDNQIFKYDTEGNSPTSELLLRPQTIMPLSFTLYSPEGTEIPASEIGASNIHWDIIEEEESGTPRENTMLIDYAATGQYGEFLSFNIKDQYDPDAVNNNIGLVVHYDEKDIRTKATLFFLKEGENGSNGTSYVIKVVPNLSPDETLVGKPYYYVQPGYTQKFNFEYPENQFPFKTLFYKNGELVYDSSLENGNQIDGYVRTKDTIYKENKRYYRYDNETELYEYLVPIIDDEEQEGDYTPNSYIGSAEVYESIVQYNFLNRTYIIQKNANEEIINSKKDKSNFFIDYNDNDIYYDDSNTASPELISEHRADILKATLTYDNLVWYYYYPINLIEFNENVVGGSGSNYKFIIPEETGFSEVVYTADGRNPNYKGINNFDFIVTKSGSSIDTTKDWEVQGHIYTTDLDWQYSNDLEIEENINEDESVDNIFYATEKYDGNCVSNAFYCSVSEGNIDVATVHLPIVMYLNTYGNAYINEWNGNVIEINEDGGIILTPQIAAGQKEEDNTFTGIIGGKAKKYNSTDFEEGIFGYNHGERTFELNAEDGSAKFGRTGAGQIILTPQENREDASAHSIIKSGNYRINYIPVGGAGSNDTYQRDYIYFKLEEGNYIELKPITDYQIDARIEQNNIYMMDVGGEGEGFEIDLTDPHIRFGSGNFRVEKDGKVYATGYTTIEDLTSVKTEIMKAQGEPLYTYWISSTDVPALPPDREWSSTPIKPDTGDCFLWQTMRTSIELENGRVPEWKPGTYYEREGSFYVMLSSEPLDWEDNYMTYYYLEPKDDPYNDPDVFIPVQLEIYEDRYTDPLCLSLDKIKRIYQEFAIVDEDSTVTEENADDFTWGLEKPQWQEESSLWVRTVSEYYNGGFIRSGYCKDSSWQDTAGLSEILSNTKETLESFTENGGVVNVESGHITITSQDKQERLILDDQGIGFQTYNSTTGEWETFTTVWGLDGTFDAQDITVKNLKADYIINGDLIIGQNSDGQARNGALKIYDEDDNLIIYGSGSDGLAVSASKADSSDNSIVHTRIDPEDGLKGYDSNGEVLYAVSDDNFWVERQEVEDCIYMGGFIIKDITSGNNRGIGFIPNN